MNAHAPIGQLQRKVADSVALNGVQLGVQRVIRAPGQPLDAANRAAFEPRFKHDFGKVKIHDDPDAAASAHSVNALAYTVGHNIVFDRGQYAPSLAGRRLLAHELTHVVQQRDVSSAADQLVSVADGPAETEAEAIANDFAHSPEATPLTARHLATAPIIARQPTAKEFPGFSQGDYVTCGAASIISAILIWDREREDPNAPNTLLAAACDTILVYLDDHQTALVRGWNSISIEGRSGRGQELYDDTFVGVTSIRDAAQLPKAQITQGQYEILGLALYVLFNNNGSPGLGADAREQLLKLLGLHPTGSATGRSFDALMDELAGLMPGQTAQVSWYSRGNVRADGKAVLSPHAFLIGRFQRGTWFVSDQGRKPPVELEAPDLATLKSMIRSNTQAQDGGIHTGEQPAMTIATGVSIIKGHTDAGVMILGDRAGIETEARSVIMARGDFIAEVDASWLPYSGDRIEAKGFVARTTALDDAKVELGRAGTDAGGIIVENPIGLFHAFKTSLVRDENVMQREIDERDSAGGKLAQPRLFYSAWLQLRSRSKTGSLFKVY